MSAETLRLAASLMRERAEAAGSGDHVGESWVAAPMIDPANNGWRVAYRPEVDGFDDLLVETPYDYEGSLATHLSGWHPAVALAVADWLEDMAAQVEKWHLTGANRYPYPQRAVAVANAYLGDVVLPPGVES